MNHNSNGIVGGQDNEDQILVTAVIPCYNHGIYLDEAISSVLNSSLDRVEIIVVNDGSTDPQTLEILSVQSWPNTRIIHQENKGLAAARNTGIAHARGKFILPLDSDDRIDPLFLEQAVWLLLNREDLGFIYCYAQLFGNETGIWVTGDFNPRKLIVKNYIPAAAVFPKRVWEEVGGYDESDVLRAGFEDWDFWLRVAGMGYRGYCIHRPLFFYRKHSGSMLTGSRLKSKELTGYIFKKNEDLIDALKKNGRKTIDLAGILYFFLNLYRSIYPVIPPAFHAKAKKIYHSMTTLKAAESSLDKLKVTEFNKQLHEIEKTRARFSASKVTTVKVKGHADDRVKVLYILPWLQVGGVESVFLNLIKGLESARFKTFIITTHKSANDLEPVFRTYCDGILHLPGFIDDPEGLTNFCLHFISSRNIDLIHISNSQIGYLITDAVKEKFPDIKMLDTLHMEEPYAPWDYFRYSGHFKDNLSKRVVVSNYLKNSLIQQYGEFESRVRTIYNGIDLTKFKVKETGGDTSVTLGFVGRFVEQKQPLRALQILQELRRQAVDVRLIMYGDGPLSGKAKAEARRLGLGNAVSFPGWVDNVSEVLRQEIDVLLQPSLREGLPVIGIEAMACGLPVVASDVRGWDEVIQHGETGFLCHSLDDFVKSVAELAGDTALRHEMGDCARKHAEKYFDSTQMVKQYSSLYLDLKQVAI